MSLLFCLRRKYEEIYPPTVAEFVYITDDTYTSSQLKRMEHVMLKMLAFDMSAPTANWFLNYYIDNGADADDTVKHLAQVSAFSDDMLRRKTFNRNGKSFQALVQVQTGYIGPTALKLCRILLAFEYRTPPAP